MNEDIEKEIPAKPSPKILVVDDEAKNRELLAILLESEGYEVLHAASGLEALKSVADVPPDVILLDVMMPDMDGIEVCEKLKADNETLHIPVIMVTALIEREYRLKCIRAGARDFLNKPIDPQDVLLRVGNAVTSKKMHDELEENYLKLKRLEELRDTLTQMIVHDLKSPLTAVHGSLQLLDIHQPDLNDSAKCDLEQAYNGARRLIDMINNLLDISHLESGEMKLSKAECGIGDVVNKSVESIRYVIDDKEIKLNVAVIEKSLSLDSSLIRRVIDNYISNAIKFSPQGGNVNICSCESDGFIRIEVIDEGPGLDPKYHHVIFDKFKQAELRLEGEGRSVGLGLAFCKLAVEAHGGEVGIESEPGKGSTFWFTLPVSE